jgi:hypothetical protein
MFVRKYDKKAKYMYQTITGGFFGFFMYILYSTLLHLPPLRFHSVGGCWGRTIHNKD